MIDIISLAIIFLTEIIFYIMVVDIILSWLMLFGVRFRPKFISDILDPVYSSIKSILPTTFGPLDFTPIIVIMIIYFIRAIVILLNPGVLKTIEKFLN
ncbi:MAG: YggT family protein [Candidatus Gracilibacteria bacterium]|nr:YggT family protein [Candidatus Gracilibacteria bacterium]